MRVNVKCKSVATKFASIGWFWSTLFTYAPEVWVRSIEEEELVALAEAELGARERAQRAAREDLLGELAGANAEVHWAQMSRAPVQTLERHPESHALRHAGPRGHRELAERGARGGRRGHKLERVHVGEQLAHLLVQLRSYPNSLLCK